MDIIKTECSHQIVASKQVAVHVFLTHEARKKKTCSLCRRVAMTWYQEESETRCCPSVLFSGFFRTHRHPCRHVTNANSIPGRHLCYCYSRSKNYLVWPGTWVSSFAVQTENMKQREFLHADPTSRLTINDWSKNYNSFQVWIWYGLVKNKSSDTKRKTKFQFVCLFFQNNWLNCVRYVSWKRSGMFFLSTQSIWGKTSLKWNMPR